jgi:hypothetical protein
MRELGQKGLAERVGVLAFLMQYLQATAGILGNDTELMESATALAEKLHFH